MPFVAMPSRSRAFDLRHPLRRSLEAHRAAQFLRLAAGEIRDDHRHAQQLLLKQRHAERALEHRLEQRMRVRHGLVAAPPRQIRMHHLADDGTGTNDGDFDDEIVEMLGLHARQRRHLRARLDLKHADRVGVPEHLVDGRIVGRQVGQIHFTS